MARVGFCIFLIGILTGFFGNAVAQSNLPSPEVQLNVTSSDQSISAKQRVQTYMKEFLKSRNVLTEANPDIEMMVDVITITKDSAKQKRHVLSVVSAVPVNSVMPQLVKLGKEKEIVYKSYESSSGEISLPEESHIIRQSISENYIKRFKLIERHQQYLVREDELRERCRNIVIDILVSERSKN